jgi:hypothetical protein
MELKAFTHVGVLRIKTGSILGLKLGQNKSAVMETLRIACRKRCLKSGYKRNFGVNDLEILVLLV